MGVSVAGVIGVAPIYIANRFSPERRGSGGGVVYHSAAAVGAAAPVILGSLLDAQWVLRDAMSVCVAAATVTVLILAWRERSWG
jgi:MFS family permease